MVLHKSPDGMSYGRYVRYGDGSFGFVPVIAAAITALPAILDILNPKQPPAPPPPPPPNNLPLVLGAGLGGLMVVGGIAYLILKK